MRYKIIFSVILIVIFIIGYIGTELYATKCHKGRVIDSVVLIFLYLLVMLIIGVFVKIYNNHFHIF